MATSCLVQPTGNQGLSSYASQQVRILTLLSLLLLLLGGLSEQPSRQQFALAAIEQEESQPRRTTTHSSSSIHSLPRQADVMDNNNNNNNNNNELATNTLPVEPPNSSGREQWSILEHRLDRLEFELRKAIHLQAKQVATGSKETPGQPEAASRARELTELARRLELMEKFVASSTSKLYETEQRVRQLERCECRLGCKWISQNGTQIAKADGELWENKCDVCSCQRGSVRCRHLACPELKCADPHYVSGKCCPVCYKPCVYRGQTVRHGNKMVISSSGQDTCKECMCMDGLFKCQRVEIERSARPADTSPGARRIQRSTPISEPKLGLIEEDQLTQELADLEWPAWDFHAAGSKVKRHSHLDTGHLICPPIDCPAREQFRLKNDCCTYCRSHDFCQLGWPARARCHPNAICSRANVSELLDQQAAGQNGELLELEATFSCRCRDGFRGDGLRHCHDHDECASPSSNGCNPSRSHCINLSGGYECRCKPGYVSANASAQVAPCLDVNECQSAELNRCHPNARCINTAGSYQCRCRRGYLGNGFECHRWLSEDPGVAAYLHRHTPARANSSLRPLGSLPSGSSPVDKGQGDEGEDEDDEDQEDSPNVSYSAPDGEEAAPPLSASSQPADGDQMMPRLSESKWEPLMLSYGGELRPSSQQTGLDNANNHDIINNNNSSNNQYYRADFVPSALNTRTMFFQAPPKSKPTPTTTTAKPSNVTTRYVQANASEAGQPARSAASQSNATSSVANLPASAANNEPVYIHRSSQNVAYQEENKHNETNKPPQTSNDLTNGNNNGQQQRLTNRIASSASLSSSTAQDARGYRRGAIIASANTSPTKGQSSLLSASPRSYHRSKALGVASSAASGSFIVTNYPRQLVKHIAANIGTNWINLSLVRWILLAPAPPLLLSLIGIISALTFGHTVFCIHINHVVTV